MSDSPYQTPASGLLAPTEVEMPIEVLRNIKRGWIAAIVSGVLTLAIMIVAMNTDAFDGLYDVWMTVDVVLIFLLAFGIYKKSRVAATMMFVYFLMSKIWMVVETGEVNGLFFGAIFLYLYAQAMISTYKYHALVKEFNASSQSAQGA